MMNKWIILVFSLLCLGTAHAQRNEIFSERIKTLTVRANGEWNTPSVITLNSSDQLQIAFDDLTHEYVRYAYRIEHCDAEWQPTRGLFTSDFISGFADDQIIETYEQSLNTTMLYTHYSFALPNANMRIRLSGNYRVTVFDDNDDEKKPVCQICFSVVEPLMDLSVSATTNTTVDWNRNHQQIEMKLSYNNLSVSNAEREIRTVVMQNRRWDNAVVNPTPDFRTPGGLEWKNNRSLIFAAGNEYRKFELLNLHVAGMNVDRIAWFAPYYHATLMPDNIRRNYIYDEEKNGGFYVRTDDNGDDDTESDYVFVHFTLNDDVRHTDGDYYLDGQWTNNCFVPEYKMTYNAEKKCYEAAILLKQGYYNYQYLFVPQDGNKKGFTEKSEGDFFQTENEYRVMVYYCPVGSRYDRLVACRTFIFAPGK